MRNRSIEVIVGLFICLSLGALIVLSLKVSGLNDEMSSKDCYTVHAYFENIGGLKVRSKVTLYGVKVGKVEKISLDKKEGAAIVTMRIDSDIDYLPLDSHLSILTSGLLGDNYIGIVPGFDDESLKNDSFIGLENTNSAIVLEQLVSKFFANQASA